MTPMVTATVQTPSAKGTAAAASEPNTASSTISTMGRFQRSAAAMSLLVLAWAAAPSAPCPMTYRRTLPLSMAPGRSPSTPTLARSWRATSTAPVLSKPNRSAST